MWTLGAQLNAHFVSVTIFGIACVFLGLAACASYPSL